MAWLAQHPDFQKGTAFSLSNHMGSFPSPATRPRRHEGSTRTPEQYTSAPGGIATCDALTPERCADHICGSQCG